MSVISILISVFLAQGGNGVDEHEISDRKTAFAQVSLLLLHRELFIEVISGFSRFVEKEMNSSQNIKRPLPSLSCFICMYKFMWSNFKKLGGLFLPSAMGRSSFYTFQTTVCG